MDGYQVAIEEIRTASHAAKSAAEQARHIDLGGAISSDFPAGGVVAALPESQSALEAPTVSDKWDLDLAEWAAEVDRYAQNLMSSADLYAANEEQAKQNLRLGPMRSGARGD